MNISVRDVLELFCFPEDVMFKIFEMRLQINIFEGYLDDVVDDIILDAECMSIDNIYPNHDGYITFNIAIAEEF